uniref:Pentacotripeptide-repeat region of PRORP domain-containing protein n=1 Tax=Salix viminalis TaxID=40686 RepID=A0A6N2MBA2_SALVM
MNAILDMYVKRGCLDSAREIFDTMGVRDVFSWTSMVNGYAKTRELEMARALFNEMPERNVVSWNAMIAGVSQTQPPKEALDTFSSMLEARAFVPMENTLWIYQNYVRMRYSEISVILANALVDMYAKCGVIHEAAKVFNEMPERNLVSWNSMITAYASHGHAKQALNVFEQMISGGFKPDDITLVGVLSACNHGGLVAQGREYFQNMKRKYGVEPKKEHLSLMIDLLV